MRLIEAKQFGRISDRNSKMPASSFATHTKACNVGAKLSTVANSVCKGCYAKKHERMYPSVDQGHWFNTTSAATHIAINPEGWAEAMAMQIEKVCAKFGEPYHRWFDAGDLADVAMLEAIVRVAELTPSIKHWLPTREGAILKAYKAAHGDFPPNLIIRMSSTMIDDAPISGHAFTSTVHSKGSAWVGSECRAADRNHACGPCRACWDRSIPNVSYPLHA